MALHRTTALFTGAFFIGARLTGLIAAAMVGSFFGGGEYLLETTSNIDLTLTSSIMKFVMATSVAAIFIAVYLILKQMIELIAVSTLAKPIK